MKDHLSWIKDMLGATDTPEAENAALLRRMVDDGDDLTIARDIDFNHRFPTERAALDFEAEARARGYDKAGHDFWPEQECWLTSVTVRMLPELEPISKTERALDEIALPFEGTPDGWGCMEMVPAAP